MALEDQIDKLTGAVDTLRTTMGDVLKTWKEMQASMAAIGGESEQAPKRGRGRPPKTETVQQTEVDVQTEDAAADPAQPETPTTIEQVKAAAFALKDKHGTAAAKAMVTKHGADILANLKPDVFAAFVADCEAAMASPAEEDLSHVRDRRPEHPRRR